MSRLIEVRDLPASGVRLDVRVGDVLLVSAAGGRVRSGGDRVDFVGALRSAVVGLDGSVLAPEGPPNLVLVRALRAGRAVLELTAGDPFQSSGSVPLTIEIA